MSDLSYTHLAVADTMKVVSSLPEPIAQFLKDMDGKVILAGGVIRDTVRNLEYKDIDLFVLNGAPLNTPEVDKAVANAVKELFEDDYHVDLTAGPYSYTIKVFGPKGEQDDEPITLDLLDEQDAAKPRYTIQVVNRIFETARDVIANFDFTFVKAAVWYEQEGLGKDGWRTLCDARFYEDLRNNTLRYSRDFVLPEYADSDGNSFIRLLKFVGKGYRVDINSTTRLLASITKDTDGDPSAIYRKIRIPGY